MAVFSSTLVYEAIRSYQTLYIISQCVNAMGPLLRGWVGSGTVVIVVVVVEGGEYFLEEGTIFKFIP